MLYLIDMRNKLLILMVFLFAVPSIYGANKTSKNELQKLEIKNFEVLDFPSDRGDSVIVVWDKENSGMNYELYLSTNQTNWVKFKEIKSEDKPEPISLPFWVWKNTENRFAFPVNLVKVFGLEEDKYFNEDIKNINLYAKIKSVSKNKSFESQIVNGKPHGNWFRKERINNFVLVLLITVIFFVVVSHAKKRDLFIRKIPGLDAIDEAVGRATEMGKPVIYVPGIGGMSSISTIASVFILGEVSKKIAQYDSAIKVPHYDPIVYTVAKETVKQSYIEAERPDSYRDDINVYVTSDQFAYAAAIDGMITREKPAACFYMGYFMAESLLLAEVGASSGAIQIAGTDVDHQLPFFVTACDYTLIGEELYAAGAYISKEPMLVSALKVQDFGKLLFITLATVLSITFLIMSKTGNVDMIGKILDILRVK
jgi:hypothetical protein